METIIVIEHDSYITTRIILVNTVRFTVKHQHYRHAYDADTCTNVAPTVIEMQSKTTTLQLLHVHEHVHSIAEAFCFTLEF